MTFVHIPTIFVSQYLQFIEKNDTYYVVRVFL